MRKIEIDARMKSLGILSLCAAVFFVSIYMIITSINRYSVIGIQKENGRIEIETSENYLFMIPRGKETIAPVTNAKIFAEAVESGDPELKLVIFTTKGKFIFDGKKTGLNEEQKKEFFDKLINFIETGAVTDFSESFYSFSYLLAVGILLGIASFKFGVYQYGHIPAKSKDKQDSNIFKELAGKAISSAKKMMKDKQEAKQQINKPQAQKKAGAGQNDLGLFVDKVIKVLLPGYDKNITINPDIFKIPELHGIAIACTSVQLAEMKNRYGADIEYIVFSGETGGTAMLAAASKWLAGFKGYLIVQTDNIPPVKPSQITAFFKDHKAKYSECSILSKEVPEKNIPQGMIVKNIADRVMKISESEETWEVQEKNAEIYAGLMLFNLGNLTSLLSKLTSDGSSTGMPLTRVVELYQKNRFKINSFSVSAAVVQKSKLSDASEPFSKPEKKVKTFGLIITSPVTERDTLIKSFDALSIPEIESIAFIARQDLRDTIGELFGDEIRIISTDGDSGDGFDAGKAQEWLKNMNGNVVVISGNADGITKIITKSLIDHHNEESNTCTYIKNGENTSVYCVKADYFVYSAKRIIRDDETRKYHLSQITDILINDKKKVEEYPPA
jgi:hypothetical protein